MEGSWQNGTALFCTWESVLCVFALEPKSYSLFLFFFFSDSVNLRWPVSYNNRNSTFNKQEQVVISNRRTKWE